LSPPALCQSLRPSPLSSFSTLRRPPAPTLFPYTTLFRSPTGPMSPLNSVRRVLRLADTLADLRPELDLYLKAGAHIESLAGALTDRKSTRLNSSHVSISYAVFCLKKKKRHSRQPERTAAT